jgi:NTE family protein
MKRKKIGLALGSGGARGLAHIGVIKKLIENDIPIDFIAGSSVGALIGGLYAAYGDIKKVEEAAVNFNWGDWFNTFLDPGLGLGILKGKRVEAQLTEMIDHKNIEDLEIPFRAVATDLKTAELVVIDKGDLALAIRVSSSVPLLFHPERIANRLLVDGGMSYPVPVEIVKKMGADIVIAVNLDSVYFLNEKKTPDISPNMVTVLKNSLFLLRHHLAEKETREADIVINPDIPYVMDLDFVHKDNIIKGGEAATELFIGNIKKLFLN